MAFFARPQSAAVKIVRPAVEEEVVARQTLSPRKDSVQRQCRNIVIYGHCKYQDKGCVYYHPQTFGDSNPQPVAPVPMSAPIPVSAAAQAHAQAPASRAESPAVNIISAQAVNAPVFIPRTAAAAAVAAIVSARISTPTLPSTNTSTSFPSLVSPAPGEGVDDVFGTPAPESTTAYESGTDSHENGYDEEEYQENGHYEYQAGYDNYEYQVAQAGDEMQGMNLTESAYYDPNQMEYHPGYDAEAMEASYYNHAPMFLRQPLNYLLYTPSTPPELQRNSVHSHFVPPSNELRQVMQERSETIRGIAPPGLGLPEELQGYHTLVPLEPTGALGVERRKFGNWHSTVYRAVRSSDGVRCVLRRIENYRMMHQAAFAPIEVWSQIQHPNIVAIREAFTTKSFNDNSLVVAYAYHPNAKTLYDAHVKPKPPPPQPTYQQPVYYGGHQPRRQQQQPQQQQLPERTLWSYIVQIASAIKRVHERGYAVRMVDVTKILVTGQNRIRIGSCGIVDVLLFDTQQDVSYLQQEDLVMFGRLIFTLCTNNLSAANTNQLQKSVEVLKRTYSADVQNLALFLCSKMNKGIDQVLEMIRGRMLIEQDEALGAVDRLETELEGELENARLVRLMCKFGFINERPEFARDARWSETGDRYIIKLFRDYVFHQVDDHGNPVLDLSHVLTCLNKLDAGTDEQLMLVARDEQSCLVVSYKDIKTCVSNAFEELVAASRRK